jgi:DNA polymerase-1
MLVTDLGQLPPSLDGQGMIGIDLETFDPELKTRGPGPHRDGFIAGIAIGTEAGFRAYIPIGHETGPNVPRLSALHWLGQQLTLNVPKVGARLLYDLVFLLQAGVPCAGPWYDIQIAEPLLDENQFTYSLDRISEHWLGEGKVDAELDAFLIKTFGKKQPRSNIWRAPPALVAPYAVGDVDLPLRVFPRQKAQLEQEGLWDLFLLETRLTELLARMHLRGVPVDLKAAERLDRLYQKEYDALLASIRHSTGVEVNIWAARSIAQVFDQLGLAYPLTAKTQAPFVHQGLAGHGRAPAGAADPARPLARQDAGDVPAGGRPERQPLQPHPHDLQSAAFRRRGDCNRKILVEPPEPPAHPVPDG